MTDAVSVEDEQLGEYHRKMREIESRLGNSISFDRFMDAMQGMLDSKIETTDVRSRVKQGKGRAFTRGTSPTSVDGIAHKGGLTVQQLIDSVPIFGCNQTTLSALGIDPGTELGTFHKDRWVKHQVSVADSHESIIAELDISRWSAYQKDKVLHWLFYVCDCVALQTDVEEKAEDSRSVEFFSLTKPTYFFLWELDCNKQTGQQVSVAALTPYRSTVDDSTTFVLTLEPLSSVAQKGAGVYCRFD